MNKKEKIVNYFNKINSDTLQELGGFYAKDAKFIDPIASHNGLEEITQYFKKMYKDVLEIKFNFSEILEDNEKVVVYWQMQLRARSLNKGQLVLVDGTSLIKFNEEGLVCFHRDYFDMGQMIYRYIPVIGWVIKKINKVMK